jgi:hypothetical protein
MTDNMIDVTPSPEFCRLCEVLGYSDDVEMTPDIVVPALCNEEQARAIRIKHAHIVLRAKKEYAKVGGALTIAIAVVTAKVALS